MIGSMFLGKNNNKHTEIASMNTVKVKQPTVESFRIVFISMKHMRTEKNSHNPWQKAFLMNNLYKKNNRDSLGKFSNADRTRGDMTLRGFLSQ
jgi:uncharacterized radical SAM superfamily Fe-S cluster-containing enzyme